MKNLLFKEYRLCLTSQCVIFLLLSAMIIIPSWPSLVSFIYAFAGLMVVFPAAIANKDLEYTAMLPLRKSDVVKGKILLVFSLEILTLLWSIPFALIRLFLIDPTIPAQTAYDLGVNLALFGFVLLVDGFWNIVYFPWYYANPAKPLWPQLVSSIGSALLIVLIMLVFIFWPDGRIFLNSYTGMGLVVQLIILFGGALLFVFLTLLASHLAKRNFQKVDL